MDLVNNKIKDHEIQRMYKTHKTRVKRSSAGLDVNKIEEYFIKCDKRWDLVVELDALLERLDILGDLPNGVGTAPEIFSRENLGKIINHLPNNKSPGKRKIPYGVFKYLPEDTINEVYECFCRIFKTGIVPSQWSINSIIAIHKRKDTANFDNYRPLGLSEAIKKIFEDLIGLAIEQLFIAEEFHYGYKKNCSTSDAAYDLDLKIKEMTANRTIDDYVLFKLDIKSAFDRLIHEAINKKLKIPFY